MKSFVCAAMVCAAMWTPAHAASNREYSPATLISVQEVGSSSAADNDVDANVSDAPLASRVFTFEFDVRSGCTDYIAHYDDDSESLGSHFRPNSAVQISATKHILYLRTNGEDMRMSLVGRRPVNGCSANQSAATH